MTRRNPLLSDGSPPVTIWNSPGRLTSKASAPSSQKISNRSVFGWPMAIRDTLRSPLAPLANLTE